MIGSATHYGVNVSDMEIALEFYRDTLGFDVDRRFPMSDVQSDITGIDSTNGHIAFLDTGGLEIELISYSKPENKNIHEHTSGHDIGIAHICITVDDVNALYDRLVSDIDIVDSPKMVGNGAQILYARDPDGNYVELYEPPVKK